MTTVTKKLQEFFNMIPKAKTVADDIEATLLALNVSSKEVSRYLVSDAEGNHLPVRDEDGTVNHRLMGAAWAALHGGYRGNKYEGEGKAEAIRKLTALYHSEKIPTPNESLEGKEMNLDKNQSLGNFQERVSTAFYADNADAVIADMYPNSLIAKKGGIYFAVPINVSDKEVSIDDEWTAVKEPLAEWDALVSKAMADRKNMSANADTDEDDSDEDDSDDEEEAEGTEDTEDTEDTVSDKKGTVEKKEVAEPIEPQVGTPVPAMASANSTVSMKQFTELSTQYVATLKEFNELKDTISTSLTALVQAAEQHNTKINEMADALVASKKEADELNTRLKELEGDQPKGHPSYVPSFSLGNVVAQPNQAAVKQASETPIFAFLERANQATGLESNQPALPQ